MERTVARLAGVAMILHERPIGGTKPVGLFSSAVSHGEHHLGTLYQRRFCREIDWPFRNLVQYIAVTIFFAIGAFAFEDRSCIGPGEYFSRLPGLRSCFRSASIGLLLLADPPSGGNVGCEPVLSRPGTTALMAYVLFGERLDAVAIGGHGRLRPPRCFLWSNR